MADDKESRDAARSGRKRVERSEDTTGEEELLAPQAQRPRIDSSRCLALQNLVDHCYILYHIVIPQLFETCDHKQVVRLLPTIAEGFGILDNYISNMLVDESATVCRALCKCIARGEQRCAQRITDIALLRRIELHHRFAGLVDALSKAAERGHLSTLRWVVEEPRGVFFKHGVFVDDAMRLVDSACRGGQIAVLEWLTKSIRLIGLRLLTAPNQIRHIIDVAAKNDRADVVRWICTNIGVPAYLREKLLCDELEHAAENGFSDTLCALITMIKPEDTEWHQEDDATCLGARVLMAYCLAKDAPSSDTRLILDTFPRVSHLLADRRDDLRQDIISVITHVCNREDPRPNTAHWLAKQAHISKREALRIFTDALIACCTVGNTAFADWLKRRFKLDPPKICESHRIAPAIGGCCRANSPQTLKWLVHFAGIKPLPTTLPEYDKFICAGAMEGIHICCKLGYSQMAMHVVDVFKLASLDDSSNFHILSAVVECCKRGDIDMATWLSEHFELRKDTGLIKSKFYFMAEEKVVSLPGVEWLASRFKLVAKDVMLDEYGSMLHAALWHGNGEFAKWSEQRFAISKTSILSDGPKRKLLVNALHSHDLEMCAWTVSTFRLRALYTCEELDGVVNMCCVKDGRVPEIAWLFDTFDIMAIPFEDLLSDPRNIVAGALRKSWDAGRVDIFSYLLERFYISADQLFTAKGLDIVKLPTVNADDLLHDRDKALERKLAIFRKMMLILCSGHAALLSMGWAFWQQFTAVPGTVCRAVASDYAITEQDFEDFRRGEERLADVSAGKTEHRANLAALEIAVRRTFEDNIYTVDDE